MPAARSAASNAGQAATAAGRSSLLNTVSCRLVEQRRVVRPELLADHLVVPQRVPSAPVDHVEQHSRPLDVAQERMPQPRTGRRALDQAGNVGDGRPATVLHAEVHHAEVRFQRGERIRGDLRSRRGEGREQRRLAGVRQPHEAHVGDQAQLQPDLALLAGLAPLRMPRSLVRGGCEVDVAQAAAASARDHDLLADRDEVGDQLAAREVDDPGAGRDRQVQVLASLAVPLRPLAAAAGRRREGVPVAEVMEGRLAGVDPQVDRAAPAAVPAVGAAARNVRLAAHRGRAVTAGTGANRDADIVEEHRRHCRTAPPEVRLRSSRWQSGSGVRSRAQMPVHESPDVADLGLGLRKRTAADRDDPLEVPHGVDPRSAVPNRPDPDLEVEVRPRRVAGGADPADLLTAPDKLAAAHREGRHVVVGRVQVVAVRDPDLPAATVRLPAGEDHPAAGCGHDRGPVRRGNVDGGVAVVEVLADVVATAHDGPLHPPTCVVGGATGAATRGRAAAGSNVDARGGHLGPRCRLRRRDRCTPRAGHDQDLPDHERRVLQPVERDDLLRLDIVLNCERVQGVGVADRHDEAGHWWDTEHLSDVECALRLERVRPPQRHRRHAELVGDARQACRRTSPCTWR